MLRRLASTFVNKDVSGLIPQLERILGKEDVRLSEVVRQQHSHDESHHLVKLPDVVVFPRSVETVSAVLKLCNEKRVPLVAFGTGTGLEGGVNAVMGGVTMDLQSMDKIVSVNAEDFDCTVQPGVTRKRLNTHLHETGLWFAVDPGADASICGMAATCASGTNAVRYGTMLHNVLNLQVALANGEVIYTSGKDRRARKSSAGYNLTQLFVGSEGTLGVITEATVRLHARPTYRSAATCNFPSVHQAVDAVVATLQCSVPIARIEFLDVQQIRSCDRYSKLSLPEMPTLLLEFHGASETEVGDQAKLVGDICVDFSGSEFKWSHLPEEMERLWTARHNAYYAIVSERKGCRGFCSDVCVPISKLADVITETREDIDKSGMIGSVVGHVGDGNFHCMFPVDESNEEEMKAIWAFSDRLVMRALAAGGTCTGEHGIGLGKRKYLKEELGDGTVKVMQMLKSSLDPNGILNPGKVL